MSLVDSTQWERIANDLTEAKSENAKLLAQVGGLEERNTKLKKIIEQQGEMLEADEDLEEKYDLIKTAYNEDIKHMLKAEARIKELEEQLQICRDAHADTMNGMGKKVLELEREKR